MSPLSAKSRKTLLAVARAAIVSDLAGGPESPGASADDPELAVEAGAFVTLHERGDLRGCIGTFHARGPLARTVAAMARAAAFEDPRFPPLAAAELPLIDLQISVLTPMRRVESIEEIEVGRHGLCVAKGSRSGVLLPQVAVEYGWDRETFLVQTCRKAALPPDAWRHGAEIYSFEAEVFGERE